MPSSSSASANSPPPPPPVRTFTAEEQQALSKRYGEADQVKRPAHDFPPAPPNGSCALVPLLTENNDENNVWTVQGSFSIIPWIASLSTTMTIYRNPQTKELTIVNAIRASEQVEQEILQLGKVRHIIKLGQFHGSSDAYYTLAPQFETPKLWLLPGGSLADGLADKVPIQALTPESLPPSVPGAQLVPLQGHNFPEAFLLLPLQTTTTSTKQQEPEHVLVACDALIHMDPRASLPWGTRFLQWALGLVFASPAVNVPKPAPLWCRNTVKTLGSAIVDYWYAQICDLEWTHCIGGHGPPAKDCDRAAVLAACRAEIAQTQPAASSQVN